MNKETKGMTLVELQDVLGARIKVTLREDLSPEERQTENELDVMRKAVRMYRDKLIKEVDDERKESK